MSRTSFLLVTLAPPLLLLAVFFVAPLGYLLFVSFQSNSATDLYDLKPTIENYSQVLFDPFYQWIILRTLMSTVVVLLLCLVIGYPVAFYAARMTPRARMLLLMAMIVPLMVSNVVRAYGWVAVLSRRGVVSSALQGVGLIERPMQFLYSFEAVTLGLLTILLPFMVVSLTNSLTTIDRVYAEAAASMGAGPWSTFLRVTLPLSSPGIASGMMLVTFLALSAYVSIALLGGPRYKLLVSFVFESVGTFRWPLAAALSFILLLLALVIAMAIQMIVRPQRVQGKGK